MYFDNERLILAEFFCWEGFWAEGQPENLELSVFNLIGGMKVLYFFKKGRLGKVCEESVKQIIHKKACRN